MYFAIIITAQGKNCVVSCGSLGNLANKSVQIILFENWNQHEIKF